MRAIVELSWEGVTWLGEKPVSQRLLQGHNIVINQLLVAEAEAQSSPCFFGRL